MRETKMRHWKGATVALLIAALAIIFGSAPALAQDIIPPIRRVPDAEGLKAGSSAETPRNEKLDH